MKIISLFNEIINNFNESFKNDLNSFNLESKIKNVGNNFTLRLYESLLNNLDDKFKNSKETRQRTLITSIDTPIPIFETHSENNKLNELLSFRSVKFI